MDEAYFGGSRKGGGGRRLRNDKGEYYKTPVVGMAETARLAGGGPGQLDPVRRARRGRDCLA